MLVGGQQSPVVGSIAEPQGEGDLAAVHHAGIHEGRERVDLVANFVLVFGTRRRRAEEGDAVTPVLDAGVIGGNLEQRALSDPGPSPYQAR